MRFAAAGFEVADFVGVCKWAKKALEVAFGLGFASHGWKLAQELKAA